MTKRFWKWLHRKLVAWQDWVYLKSIQPFPLPFDPQKPIGGIAGVSYWNPEDYPKPWPPLEVSFAVEVSNEEAKRMFPMVICTCRFQVTQNSDVPEFIHAVTTDPACPMHGTKEVKP